MVKVKWNKLCGTNENRKMGQSLWDGGSNMYKERAVVFQSSLKKIQELSWLLKNPSYWSPLC